MDCYYLSNQKPAFLIDPLVPKKGSTDSENDTSQYIFNVTNRLRDRHCRQFIKAFDVTVARHEPGLHEFADDNFDVTAFRLEHKLPDDVRAFEVGSFCPEKPTLLISIQLLQ